MEKIEQFGLDNIVATCASPMPMPDAPFATSWSESRKDRAKGPSPGAGKASFFIGGRGHGHGDDASSDDDRRPFTPALGVPARPGTGQLDTRLNQLKKLHQQQQQQQSTPRRSSRSVRPDLGCVPSPVGGGGDATARSATTSEASTTLGTLSSLWFGRKGGLL